MDASSPISDDPDIARLMAEAHSLKERSENINARLRALNQKIADMEEEQRVRRAHLAEQAASHPYRRN